MSLYPTVISSATNLRPKPKPVAKKAVAKPKAAPTDTQLAQQQIDPLIQSITDRVNARAKGAQQAVTGYGNSLASYLSGIDYAAPERQAIPQQAATDAALQQSLAGKGNDLAQGLASRLASIQEPHAVDPAVQAVQQFGAGTGNTQLAQGSASLGNLLANQASAGEYGLKQPGIAKTATLQGIGKVGAQAVNDIADQTGALTAKIPDIVANIQSNRANQQTAAARQQQLNLENRLAGKKFGLDVQKTNAGIVQNSERIGIAQQNARTAQAREQRVASYAEKNYGISVQKLRDAEAKAATARKSGGLTAKQLADFQKQAATDLDAFYHGVAAKYQVGADGSHVLVDGTGPGSAKSYQQAIQTLTLKYPALGPKRIISLVNKLYKPGEGGRPQYTATQTKQMKQINATLFPNLDKLVAAGGR